MKPIKETPNLFVTETGRIWSKPRSGTKGGWLQTPVNHQGYKILSTRISGRARCLKVHILVATAYIGDRPDGHVINHIDGNKLNNNASNLEYCTHRDNMLHAYSQGLIDPKKIRGEKNPQAVITEADVRQIRALSGKQSQKSMAKKFGLRQSTISKIIKRKRWAHVDG